VRVLVTGGAGFIGSNLVDALVARGDEVTVVDNLVTGKPENLRDSPARLVEADITHPLQDVFAQAQPELVFHLAAQVDVRRSVSDPEHDLRVNGHGTLNVLHAAREAGARHVVYASTGGAIYGDAEIVPTPEFSPILPLAPYGHSKFTGEGYCRLFRELHDLRTTSVRFANVYGPRQDPLGEGGVIAIFCGKALSAGTATIYGTGRQTRDFVFVGDVVQACLAAADGAPFGPYNVGTGAEVSVNDLAVALGRVVGRPLELEYAPARPGEVERSCLSPERIREELGWVATTSLEDGLQRTLDWAAAQPA
jgi:UDP-glucose 4-epimerase